MFLHIDLHEKERRPILGRSQEIQPTCKLAPKYNIVLCIVCMLVYLFCSYFTYKYVVILLFIKESCIRDGALIYIGFNSL